MPIAGWIGTTLVDYPARVAAVVFFSGCNLRCPFFHNASLVLPNKDTPQLLVEEVLTQLRRRVGFISGVVFTGGEPLMDPLLGSMVEETKKLGLAVKIDTNGTWPEKLHDVLDFVDYVALDLKAAPSKYEKATGGKSCFEPVRQTLQLLAASKTHYEVRTTVVPGLVCEQDFDEIVPFVRGVPVYALQEFRPIATLDPTWLTQPPTSLQTMQAIRDRLASVVGRVEIRAH